MLRFVSANWYDSRILDAVIMGSYSAESGSGTSPYSHLCSPGEHFSLRSVIPRAHGGFLSLVLAFGAESWPLSFGQSDETVVASIRRRELEKNGLIGFVHLKDAGRHLDGSLDSSGRFAVCTFQLGFRAFH